MPLIMETRMIASASFDLSYFFWNSINNCLKLFTFSIISCLDSVDGCFDVANDVSDGVNLSLSNNTDPLDYFPLRDIMKPCFS